MSTLSSSSKKNETERKAAPGWEKRKVKQMGDRSETGPNTDGHAEEKDEEEG